MRWEALPGESSAGARVVQTLRDFQGRSEPRASVRSAPDLSALWAWRGRAIYGPLMPGFFIVILNSATMLAASALLPERTMSSREAASAVWLTFKAWARAGFSWARAVWIFECCLKSSSKEEPCKKNIVANSRQSAPTGEYSLMRRLSAGLDFMV